ncbi:MAG: hypothetical protein ACR2J1_00555 [Methyloceanibacter sp.]|uniref:hypothetical protein n=1 Tax=Methyloceanibacter sp. TaxID=1965321 RepID=UPI003D9B5A13
MVAQKGSPSLTWRPASLGHVLGNARLRDLKPELEQFAMDARRAQKRVLNAHSPDQYASGDQAVPYIVNFTMVDTSKIAALFAIGSNVG